MNQELLKKYGVWIAAGALVLYLVYKNVKPSTGRSILPAAAGSGSDYALESERLRQAGVTDVQKLQIDSALEQARLKAANDRFNLEQQAIARNRALDTASRNQTLGLIGQIANSIAGLFKPTAQQKPGTPPTFPSGGSGAGGTTSRTQLPAPPYYPVPAPNIPGLYNPPYEPQYPQISDLPLSVTDWGEAPQFSSAGTTVDTGASFYDQYSNIGVPDFNYGYGDYNLTAYSAFPELSSSNYYQNDVGAGGDFSYGYGYDNDTGGASYYEPVSDYYSSGGGGGTDYGNYFYEAGGDMAA